MNLSPESLRRIAKSLETRAEEASQPMRIRELARQLRIKAQAQELDLPLDQDGSAEWGPDA